MAKKPVALDGLLNTTSRPIDTGIPQRGAVQRKPKAERRSDQMSIRMKPSTRQMIEDLAEADDMPIAEIIERAIHAYRTKR